MPYQISPSALSMCFIVFSEITEDGTEADTYHVSHTLKLFEDRGFDPLEWYDFNITFLINIDATDSNSHRITGLSSQYSELLKIATEPLNLLDTAL